MELIQQINKSNQADGTLTQCEEQLMQQKIQNISESKTLNMSANQNSNLTSIDSGFKEHTAQSIKTQSIKNLKKMILKFSPIKKMDLQFNQKKLFQPSPIIYQKLFRSQSSKMQIIKEFDESDNSKNKSIPVTQDQFSFSKPLNPKKEENLKKEVADFDGSNPGISILKLEQKQNQSNEKSKKRKLIFDVSEISAAFSNKKIKE